MSVQRSPPVSQISLDILKPNPLQYKSDSALNAPNNTTQESNYFNISKRQKRTFDDTNEQQISSISEMTALFNDKFELLNNAMLTIMTQNQEINQTVKDISSKHEQLLTKLNILERENSVYKQKLNILENKLDTLERHTRCTTMEVRNIPKQEKETRAVLVSIIKQIGLQLNPDKSINDSDIRDIFRNKSEAVIVDFSTVSQKENLILQYKSFNKLRRQKKEPLFNTEHINLLGSPCPIFVSEYLTTKARRLFYLARANVKNKKLAAAWTSYGKIYIKKEEDSPPIRIDDESDLPKLDL
ncbi:unnamed protein product [Chilo suppressalis]|uniref:FP protein C-terminal domain-containing protein n=1 Tax=Chilo suppressalis TaxID=168631 RepID=A0ABN8B156_CHISP|nr:unnamed protein product [Chilo suppressalis]